MKKTVFYFTLSVLIYQSPALVVADIDVVRQREVAREREEEWGRISSRIRRFHSDLVEARCPDLNVGEISVVCLQLSIDDLLLETLSLRLVEGQYLISKENPDERSEHIARNHKELVADILKIIEEALKEDIELVPTIETAEDGFGGRSSSISVFTHAEKHTYLRLGELAVGFKDNPLKKIVDLLLDEIELNNDAIFQDPSN
jgi:hypothetical protein